MNDSYSNLNSTSNFEDYSSINKGSAVAIGLTTSIGSLLIISYLINAQIEDFTHKLDNDFRPNTILKIFRMIPCKYFSKLF